MWRKNINSMTRAFASTFFSLFLEMVLFMELIHCNKCVYSCKKSTDTDSHAPSLLVSVTEVFLLNFCDVEKMRTTYNTNQTFIAQQWKNFLIQLASQSVTRKFKRTKKKILRRDDGNRTVTVWAEGRFELITQKITEQNQSHLTATPRKP